MSYDAPTPVDLKARFPAFADVADATVQYALDEAARRVDTTWTEGDFATARMLYAAHVLTMDGFGTGAEADAIAEGSGLYKSLKAGNSQVVFADGADIGAAGTITATSYGRRFYEIQRLNVGGPLTTGGYFGGECADLYIGPFHALPCW